MSKHAQANELRNRLRRAAHSPALLTRAVAHERSAASTLPGLLELADAVRDVLLDDVCQSGENQARLTASAIALACNGGAGQLVAVERALLALERTDQQSATIARLRFYADLDLDSIAGLLSLPLATVRRAWNAARAALRG